VQDRRPALLFCVAALFAAGCSVGPKYKRPAAPAPPAYKEAAPAQGWTPGQPAAAMLRPDWWTVFGDSGLDGLEAQVDVSNQNLKAAVGRFEQARALIRFNRASRYPTVTAGGAITTNRESATRTLASPASSTQYGDFLLPVDVSYEVDAWGRIRHTIEAAREEAQATAADLETVRLSLHAELAVDYFELRSADAEQKLLDDTVAAYQRALQLTQNRFQGGVASGVEVAQAQTQLESTRAAEQDIAVRRDQYEHAIAVLIGKPPAQLTLPPNPWTAAPPRIPPGLPSELLERRPDIASAERRVAEANEQIGIAQTAFFPTVLLQAGIGFEGSSITNWLNWPSRFWAVGPSILQTVFDGGRRRASQQAATANYDTLVANYRETVLEAFQQVEDNLAELRVLQHEADTQHAAVQAAEHSLQLSMNQYTGGLVTYLQVVTAQSTALANEITAVDILRRRMDATVLLIKGLGGGWNVSTLPSLK
jgi:NodT family efflux transporter outer membrane factor (OMF) lipoprotein